MSLDFEAGPSRRESSTPGSLLRSRVRIENGKLRTAVVCALPERPLKSLEWLGSNLEENPKDCSFGATRDLADCAGAADANEAVTWEAISHEVPSSWASIASVRRLCGSTALC